jgi:hypothetical protein
LNRFSRVFLRISHDIRRTRWEPPKQPTRSGPGDLYARFWRDGIVPLRMTGNESTTLAAACAKVVEDLLARRTEIAASNRSFADGLKALPRDAFPVVEDVLRAHGVMEVASTYLQAKAAFKFVSLQIVDPGESSVENVFRDVNLRDPASVYMHIDSSYRTVKCMIYLTEVGPDNGPFCYVPGTQHIRRGLIEESIRRTNDKLFGHRTDPEARRFICALPTPLRKKGQFGNDLLDDNPAGQALVAAELAVTSDVGNLILFDNSGIHRGSLIRAGQRQCLQVVIVPSVQ